jgi:deoxyribodipyrimidine photo-lyase
MAKIFLDYEPGIHYTQFQMQAGTTGVNTVRIYNPVKQSKDHDPEGIFIKQWVDELKDVPKEFIHEPWMMTEMDKIFYQLNYNYKTPIVDLVSSGRLARAKIWDHRKTNGVKLENKRIINTHIRKGK